LNGVLEDIGMIAGMKGVAITEHSFTKIKYLRLKLLVI
jgi:hypothetical protein